MTDRELLELAAKALVREWKWDQPRGSNRGWFRLLSGDRWVVWNPIDDDGLALRLAVSLGINIEFDHDEMNVGTYSVRDINKMFSERSDKDPAAAVRRAIVRAAAEIGKAMP